MSDLHSWPKLHDCGAVITESEWPRLPKHSEWDFGDGVVLEQRMCPGGCESHLAIQISGPLLEE